MRDFFHQVEEWYYRHERFVSAGALLLGFVIDNFTLTRVDLLFDNVVLLSYLVIAFVGIVVFNLIDIGKLRGHFFEKIAPLFPLLAQFAFGGLFSGYFIFYSRSASVFSSWVFVFILIALLIGNERFKKQYLRFRFQMSIFFIALFSFVIFSVPTFIGKIGTHIFIFSGLLSVAIMICILWMLKNVMPEKIEATRNTLAASISGIFLLFNFLYFSNAIPPLPLSLKDIGLYHSAERMRDGYLVLYEDAPWYRFYRDYDTTFHLIPGESVYVFSSVFAPTRLETKILHQWQKFDEETGIWTTTDTFSFPIVGGRDGGYRGFTRKSSVSGGKWRVNVITEHGQIVGRISFYIKGVVDPVVLSEKIL